MEICNYIEQKEKVFDTSISNAQHQIDLLQEYKQSLITEVVTGKRKVTDNWQQAEYEPNRGLPRNEQSPWKGFKDSSKGYNLSFARLNMCCHLTETLISVDWNLSFISMKLSEGWTFA